MIIRMCVWCKLSLGEIDNKEEFLPGIEIEETKFSHGLCIHCYDFEDIAFYLSRGPVKFILGNNIKFNIGHWKIQTYTFE